MTNTLAPLVTLDGLTDPTLPAVIGIPRIRAEMPKSAWLEWLESHSRFRFEIPGGKFTAYKSAKGYWTAQRRVHGKLRHEYLGSTQALTYEVLNQIAKKMNMGDCAYWREKYPDPRSEQKSVVESHIGNYETASEVVLQTTAKLLEMNRQVTELTNHCTYLENENNRLKRLEQECSQATVAKLNEKYAKAQKEIQQWKESSESYQRQAARLKAELDESLGNQEKEELVRQILKAEAEVNLVKDELEYFRNKFGSQ